MAAFFERNISKQNIQRNSSSFKKKVSGAVVRVKLQLVQLGGNYHGKVKLAIILDKDKAVDFFFNVTQHFWPISVRFRY